MTFRINLLRAALNDEGGGFMVWYLAAMDGGGHWAISWVAALMADFENFFRDFDRRDELAEATPDLDENDFAVLVCENERLVIVMNASDAQKNVTLKMRNLPRNPVIVEYESGKKYDLLEPVELIIAGGEIRVLHVVGE